MINHITAQLRRFFKQNSFLSRLLKNLFISFLGEGGAAFFTFLTTLVLICLIGNTNYGILTVAFTFILIIDGFVNFQSWHAIITFGSTYLESKDYIRLEKLIKICSIIDILTAIIGTIIALFTIDLFSHILQWDSNVVNCVYYLSLTILFNFTGTSVGLLRLLDQFKLYSIFRVGTEALKLILVIIFCYFLDWGLVGAVLAYTLGYVIGYLFLFFLFIAVIKAHPHLSLKRIILTKIKGEVRPIFNFTFWTCLSSSADIPVQQFDSIFLSMISYDIVSVFKVYKQIGQILSKLTTPLKQSIMPLFSELIAKNKKVEAYRYLTALHKKSLYILMPFIFIITIVSLSIMHFFLDPVYIEHWPILLVYLIIRGLALSYAAIHPLFISLGLVKNNFIYTLISNILYCFTVLFSIHSLGVWAILLGLAIEYFTLISLKKRCILQRIGN